LLQLKKTLLIAGIVLGLTACASRQTPQPHFIVSVQQIIAAPPADKAQIIILHPANTIQGTFPVSIFEIKENQRTMLATIGTNSKAVIMLPPGQHMLMASHFGGSTHLMQANVEAGKRYYVLSRFIYANGFQLRPLRATSDNSNYSVQNRNFKTWMNSTQVVNMTPESSSFYETIAKKRADKNQADALNKWTLKTPQERAELTLSPEDAVTDY
jgi:hypothetical protein